MAFIFTSDLHIDKGIWISISLNYLDYLYDFCEERNIKTIVVGGDIFEKATRIKNEAFLPLYLKFLDFKKNGYTLIFILGNHDIFNNKNDSIVETFSTFGRVIKNFETIEIDGFNYDLLSYTKDPEKIQNNASVLLTHLSIADFQFDNGYEVDQKNGMPLENFEHYDLVVSGHFHKHQDKKNIVFPGSPFQKTFGEESQEKGFLVIEKNKYTFIDYSQAPTHLTIAIEDFDKYEYTNKFVQVKINKKIENFVKLKHILYTRGALEVKPLFLKEEEKLFENKALTLNGSILDMLKQYIVNTEQPTLNKDKLMSLVDIMIGEIE